MCVCILGGKFTVGIHPLWGYWLFLGNETARSEMTFNSVAFPSFSVSNSDTCSNEVKFEISWEEVNVKFKIS